MYEVDDGCVHVAPIFGRRHAMSMGCWCLPHLDAEADRVVIHNAEGDE